MFQKNDEELVKIILANEHEAELAFKEIYQRYNKKIIKFIRNSVYNIDDCMDLFQHTFLNIYKGLKTYKSKYKFSTWIFKIATNVILNYKRDKARSLNFIKEYGLTSDYIYHPDYSECIYKDSIMRILNEEIVKLPEKLRLPLSLAEIGEIKTDEIAVICKITQRAVRKRITKAKEILKQNVENRVSGAGFETKN